MRDSAAIRTMLLSRLRVGLRSPGMCGGELEILNLMDYLTFIDCREDEWESQRKHLRNNGGFRSSGLHGGFHAATRQTVRNDNQPASVYALIAYEMGYLVDGHGFDVNRVLDKAEYRSMLQALDEVFFESEHTHHDIIEAFGEPSLRWGSNDNYPCILLYFVSDSPARFCYFDCWAEFYIDESGCSVPKKHGPKPILRNVRLPAEQFVDQFMFTKFGLELKAEIGG